MRELLASPVIAAIAGATIAGLFGVAAVSLGLRRFRSERWWERRATAYAAVIEALHAIEDVHDEEIQAIEKYVHLPLERLETLRVKERDAHAEIRKYASQGGFVITDAAAIELLTLTGILGIARRQQESEGEYLSNRAVAAANAIKVIKAQAKADLKT